MNGKEDTEMRQHLIVSVDSETLRKFRLLAPRQKRSALFRSMVNAEFERRGLDELCNAVDPQGEQAR